MLKNGKRLKGWIKGKVSSAKEGYRKKRELGKKLKEIEKHEEHEAYKRARIRGAIEKGRAKGESRAKSGGLLRNIGSGLLKVGKTAGKVGKFAGGGIGGNVEMNMSAYMPPTTGKKSKKEKVVFSGIMPTKTGFNPDSIMPFKKKKR